MEYGNILATSRALVLFAEIELHCICRWVGVTALISHKHILRNKIKYVRFLNLESYTYT